MSEESDTCTTCPLCFSVSRNNGALWQHINASYMHPDFYEKLTSFVLQVRLCIFQTV